MRAAADLELTLAEVDAYAARFPVVSMPPQPSSIRASLPPLFLTVMDGTMKAVDRRTWSLVLPRSTEVECAAVVGRFVTVEPHHDSCYSAVLERGSTTHCALK